MIKKLFSVRGILCFLLTLAVAYASWSAYYKITVWGFSAQPKQVADIWTIEAHISFVGNGDNVKVALSVPTENREFKIFNEDVIAKDYKIKYTNDDTRRLELTSSPKEGIQNIY